MCLKNLGFIFPTLIVLLALFSILVATSYNLIGSHTFLVRDTIHSDRAELEAEHSAIDSLKLSASPPIPAGLFCPSATSAVGEQSISRSICLRIGGAMPIASFLTESSLPDPNEFPIIDIESHLESPTPCALTPFPPSDTSASGFDLTLNAHRSAFSCTLAPTIIVDNFKTLANLELDYSISIQFSAQPHAQIIAAGFIDLPQGISLQSDLLLIAGGDIHIAALSAPYPIQVSVVSLSGFIKIDNLVGPISLKVWGRSGIALPPGLSLGVNTLNPKLLKSIYIGRMP